MSKMNFKFSDTITDYVQCVNSSVITDSRTIIDLLAGFYLDKEEKTNILRLTKHA